MSKFVFVERVGGAAVKKKLHFCFRILNVNINMILKIFSTIIIKFFVERGEGAKVETEQIFLGCRNQYTVRLFLKNILF